MQDLHQYGTVGSMSEMEVEWRIERMFMQCFGWMGAILLAAFGSGFVMYNFPSLIQISPMVYRGSMIGWLGLVIGISFFWQKMNYLTIATLLIVFGLLEWVGLSMMMRSYANVPMVFLWASTMFFVLAVIGNAVKIDVAKWWPILMGALIWLIVMWIAWMFIGGENFNIVYSFLWLGIFAAMTIFDMNMMKQMAMSNDSRVELLMALSLFLNFINMFYFLMNLMGVARD